MTKKYFLLSLLFLVSLGVYPSEIFAEQSCSGVKVYPQNPFRFDFIVEPDNGMPPEQMKMDAQRMMRYFLTAITVPEKELWVNLSPYERNRIIPEYFGRTEMGRDLLAEDFKLKQLTARLLSPETPTGKAFWTKMKIRFSAAFQAQGHPLEAINKVWVMPDVARVYETASQQTAVILESRLKVLTREDPSVGSAMTAEQAEILELFNQTVLPMIQNEVNHSVEFIKLRQVYRSLILAVWYKKKIKDSLINQVYRDRHRMAGIDLVESQEKDRIYQAYCAAFQSGTFDVVQEEVDEASEELIPRKYFSGGMTMFEVGQTLEMVSGSVGSSVIIDQAQRAMLKAGWVVQALLNVAESDTIQPIQSAFRLGMSRIAREVTLSIWVFAVATPFAQAAEFKLRTYTDGYRTTIGYVKAGETIPEILTQYLAFSGLAINHDHDFEKIVERMTKIYDPLLKEGLFFSDQVLDLRKVGLFIKAVQQLQTAQILAKSEIVIDDKQLTVYYVDKDFGHRAYAYDDIIIVGIAGVKRGTQSLMELIKNNPQSLLAHVFYSEFGSLDFEKLLISDLRRVLAHEAAHGVTTDEIMGGRVRVIKTQTSGEFDQAVEIPAILGGVIGSKAEKFRLAELIYTSRFVEINGERRHVDAALNVSIPILERLGFEGFLRQKAQDRDEDEEKLLKDFQLGIMADEDLIAFFDLISNQDVYEATAKVFEQLFSRPFNFPVEVDIPEAVIKRENLKPVTLPVGSLFQENVGDFTKGGIDLNPQNMNLQIDQAGQGVRFELSPQMLRQFEGIPGFVPKIINMQPLHNSSYILN